ncbi:MAG TPA: glycosyltransferase family 4 protein [Chitinophaga sp.]|uniref:glycosyltransferase family 4 protein n=1 Tax=Chitinophaga sp. TaxID=1869181 RepID=UPI002BEC5431|nr:glycosyltransferase family 4 protein [Chitinophaga sp.]HVI44784.1 glycosyltransferase family 4 protein [Chitinophaga sp.]
MRIVLNDHSGHAFTLELSRQLAASGHEVLHAYSTSFQSPKGNFNISPSGNLTIFPITHKKAFAKYSLIKRRKQEIEYASRLVERLNTFKPQVILSGTTPLFVQEHLLRYCRRQGIKFVYWCQDIYTVAIRQIAQQKLGMLGFPLWQYFQYLETKLLKASTHIVSITEDFNNIFSEWRINPGKVTCIPNWAPISEIYLSAKDNNWARQHNLVDKICIVYSGTLGLKHNPSIISAAAEHFRDDDRIMFIVISEGLGAQFLEKERERLGLNNMLLLPFQDFSQISDVLGTADILLAILEDDAGIYSVPSKVLTYLCACKPILLAMPQHNLSARIVQQHKAGFCVLPGQVELLCKHIAQLVADHELRKELGKNGRLYAEDHFNIRQIEEKFTKLFHTISIAE